MESDIKYLELPVGHTIDFLVLHKMDNVNLMGCEAAGNILSYVHTTMSEEVQPLLQFCSREVLCPKIF